MIIAFTCLQAYRHSSFTLRALLEADLLPMRQWPTIELEMNVSPLLATWSRFIRMHVFRGVNFNNKNWYKLVLDDDGRNLLYNISSIL